MRHEQFEHQNGANTTKMRGLNCNMLQNAVEMAVSSSNMLQIARETDRRGDKKRKTHPDPFIHNTQSCRYRCPNLNNFDCGILYPSYLHIFWNAPMLPKPVHSCLIGTALKWKVDHRWMCFFVWWCFQRWSNYQSLPQFESRKKERKQLVSSSDPHF